LPVQATRTRPRFDVTCDGDPIAGHAGAVLLADGGDCLSDLAALRDQPQLFGPVASTPTAWRVVEQVARDPDGLAGLRAARAHATAAAWRRVRTLRGSWSSTWTAPCWTPTRQRRVRRGPTRVALGSTRWCAFWTEVTAPGRRWPGILRPGNAGSNTAADHIEAIELALAQLPSAARDQPIVVRADTGGATHGLVDHLRQRGVGFSISLPADERVRAAVLTVPPGAWQPAIEPDGQPRPGAEVAELHTSIVRAGQRVPGRSAAARTPTPAPSLGSPTPTGTASRWLSPTSPTRPPTAGAAPPPPRPRRGPHPLRQGHRTAQPPLRPVAPSTCGARNRVWLELALAAPTMPKRPPRQQRPR
jgi:hypothetical protein